MSEQKQAKKRTGIMVNVPNFKPLEELTEKELKDVVTDAKSEKKKLEKTLAGGTVLTTAIGILDGYFGYNLLSVPKTISDSWGNTCTLLKTESYKLENMVCLIVFTLMMMSTIVGILYPGVKDYMKDREVLNEAGKLLQNYKKS